MPSTELMKLAPTLSAEERFKIIITDMHKEMVGEAPVLSLSEREAIIKCENRPMWDEYTRHISIMQWASAFWTKDIETEKLRVVACFLTLGRTVDRLITSAAMHMPEMIWNDRCADVREDVEFLERNAVSFFAYRDAIIQIERDHLYGMSLLDEKRKAIIASYYDAVDDMFDGHNRRIKALSETDLMKKLMNPVAEDMESYTVKQPIAPKELIDKIVAEIMGIVDSEMGMLGR